MPCLSGKPLPSSLWRCCNPSLSSSPCHDGDGCPEPSFDRSQDPGRSPDRGGEVSPLCPHQGLTLGCFLDTFLSSGLLTAQLVRNWAPHLGQHPEAVSGVFSPLSLDETAPGWAPSSCRGLLVFTQHPGSPAPVPPGPQTPSPDPSGAFQLHLPLRTQARHFTF